MRDESHRFVDMGAYNRSHFPGSTSGGLDHLVVSYAHMRIVLFIFIIARGDGKKRYLGFRCAY